jgi:hypothetical protein
MVRVFSIYVQNKACAVYCTHYKHLTIIRRMRGDYQGIFIESRGEYAQNNHRT